MIAARLLAFGAAIVVVFALAFTLGRAVGPVGGDDPAPAPMDMTTTPGGGEHGHGGGS